jgi:hypothetical protein
MHSVRSHLGAALAVAMAVFLAAPFASARNVYLNGVEIGDLRRQTFKDATVHIDENGDVHISSDRYKVEVVDEDGKPGGAASAVDEKGVAGANPQLRQRYFLVAKPSPAGRAQYDVVLKVNGVQRRVIKAGDAELIIEVSAWFKPGKNTVELAATKNLRGGRASTSSEDKARIILGAGHEDAAIVKVDVVNVDFKCDASQLEDVKKTYVFTAI